MGGREEKRREKKRKSKARQAWTRRIMWEVLQ
jgi:hypothetical protein